MKPADPLQSENTAVWETLVSKTEQKKMNMNPE